MRAKIRHRDTRISGFTLVELMITVTIVALLAMLAYPAFVKARDNARITVIRRNLRSLESAKDQWALEHRSTTGAVISDVNELKDYLRGGKLTDVANEAYVINPVGTPAAASLTQPVGAFAAGTSIPAE
jgi:prepilin-type N-terminal cleavage/methylation domain-containing protein